MKDISLIQPFSRRRRSLRTRTSMRGMPGSSIASHASQAETLDALRQHPRRRTKKSLLHLFILSFRCEGCSWRFALWCEAMSISCVHFRKSIRKRRIGTHPHLSRRHTCAGKGTFQIARSRPLPNCGSDNRGRSAIVLCPLSWQIVCRNAAGNKSHWRVRSHRRQHGATFIEMVRRQPIDQVHLGVLVHDRGGRRSAPGFRRSSEQRIMKYSADAQSIPRRTRHAGQIIRMVSNLDAQIGARELKRFRRCCRLRRCR